MPILNFERALAAAAQNGHAVVAYTLLSFATQHSIHPSDVIGKKTIYKIFYGGHAAVFRALGTAYPDVINFPLGFGNLPLYEAVRLRQTDVVAVLLELGADPLHPVELSKELATYHSSLLSRAAFAEGPHMIKMLLERGIPVAHTGALHTAVRLVYLDTMRLLMQYGADVNETLSNRKNWPPMHFAASRGKVDAMKLLADNSARSDLKDVEDKTPVQLLKDNGINEHWNAQVMDGS